MDPRTRRLPDIGASLLEDILFDWTARDAVIVMIGLALFVLVLRCGLRPGKWIDGASKYLDWLIERLERRSS
jgi:hypothetical protein